MNPRLLSLAIAQLLASGVSQGATIVVDSTSGDAIADGNCTLREAIEAASTDLAVDGCAAGTASDTILFDLAVPATITVGASRLDVLARTNIVGPGDQDDLTIDGEGATGLFNVNNATLLLSNMTLTGGRAATGGAVDIISGTLITNNVTMSGNTANYFGGAINSFSGTTSLSNTTISNNYAGYSQPGALGNTNKGPTSHAGGGGVYSSGGSVGMEAARLVGNASTFGAGLGMNGARAIINNSTIEDNISSRDGGGVRSVGGTTDITNTHINRNTATTSGGGFHNGSNFARVENSTISNNRADRGGGLFNATQSSGYTSVVNTTISGNEAMDTGGASYVSSGTISFIESTIFNNIGNIVGGIFRSPTGGGGAGLSSSVVAQNQGGDCNENAINTFNADSSTSDPNCNDQEGAKGPVDVMLGPLQDNGGPTPTHLPMAGSPLIDANPDGFCFSNDQRGEPRPVDFDTSTPNTCDIGSVERQLDDSDTGEIHSDGFETPPDNP